MTITGLTPGSSYHFRVRSADATGNHATSADLLLSPQAVRQSRLIGGTDEDQIHQVIPLSDGRFITSGWVRSTDGDISGNHGGYDYLIAKHDTNGSILWKKCVGSTADEGHYHRIIATTDGGFALGGTGDDTPHQVVLTDDGGYLVCGGRVTSNDVDVSGNHGDFDSWVVKLDAMRTIQWQRCLGGTAWDSAYYVTKTTDGYLLAGQTESTNGDFPIRYPGVDAFVVKLNLDGTIAWRKVFGGSGNNDFLTIVQPLADGSYIAVGGANSNDGDVSGNHGAYDGWILRFVE